MKHQFRRCTCSWNRQCFYTKNLKWIILPRDESSGLCIIDDILPAVWNILVISHHNNNPSEFYNGSIIVMYLTSVLSVRTPLLCLLKRVTHATDDRAIQPNRLLPQPLPTYRKIFVTKNIVYLISMYVIHFYCFILTSFLLSLYFILVNKNNIILFTTFTLRLAHARYGILLPWIRRIVCGEIL